ncbi:unnamed protein product, partial [marine sediment metagenome]
MIKIVKKSRNVRYHDPVNPKIDEIFTKLFKRSVLTSASAESMGKI